MRSKSNTENRHWYGKDENSKEDIVEIIEAGTELAFRFEEHDYFIESWGEKGYVIFEPNYTKSRKKSQTHYYEGSGRAKSAEEFLNLKFLNGKTILERFEELRFYDG